MVLSSLPKGSQSLLECLCEPALESDISTLEIEAELQAKGRAGALCMFTRGGGGVTCPFTSRHICKKGAAACATQKSHLNIMEGPQVVTVA